MKHKNKLTNTIKIDDDVLNILKHNAEPFVDNPNKVLRKLLGPPTRGRDTWGSMISGRSSSSPSEGVVHGAFDKLTGKIELPQIQ